MVNARPVLQPKDLVASPTGHQEQLQEVVSAIERSQRSDGIRLRVTRESDGPEMRTAAVEEIDREDG